MARFFNTNSSFKQQWTVPEKKSWGYHDSSSVAEKGEGRGCQDGLNIAERGEEAMSGRMMRTEWRDARWKEWCGVGECEGGGGR